MSVVAMYIAFQLAAFLFFTGEQNKIAALVAKEHFLGEPTFPMSRTYDAIFLIILAFSIATAMYHTSLFTDAFVNIAFVSSILISRNLMQIRGVYLGMQRNRLYSFSILLENFVKFILVMVAAFTSQNYEFMVLGLAAAPAVTWAFHRIQLNKSFAVSQQIDGGMTKLFSTFLFIQLSFFLTFDLPYILINTTSGSSELSASLAFLGIFAKIIFFGSISFSLIVIAKIAGSSNSVDNLRTLNMSYLMIIIGSIILVVLTAFFPDEIILLISTNDFLYLSDKLYVALTSACCFTLLFVTLNGLAAKNDIFLSRIVVTLLAATTFLSVGVSAEYLSVSQFLYCQIILFLIFLFFCNLMMRVDQIGQKLRSN